ncbi:MAG TPA: AAA family ATPase [Rhodospirillaceae bacterium]|nr:AAA family ATPase [Rhodospirillaceae bacterium]
MPYLAHFGLKDHPFALTPNTDYYYPTQENANIIASLDFALRRDTGIIKIVGEVGTGKTLLCRLLVNKLIDTDAVAYINAPQADTQSIIRAVCSEFGIAVGSKDASAYTALNRFLVQEHSKGRLAVVVVDEAQHLGKEGLEAIRLVSNLETETSKLLQIVLFGQTELDELLRDPSLRQLNQRVVFSFSTKPLTMFETRNYIAHRIRVSRREGMDYEIFLESALTAIAQASAGIPRIVNILADKSLLVAFSAGSPTVQRAHVREAIKDTPGLFKSSGGWSFSALFGRVFAIRGLMMTAAVAVGLLLASAAGWAWWRHAHIMTGQSLVSGQASTATAQRAIPPVSPTPAPQVQLAAPVQAQTPTPMQTAAPVMPVSPPVSVLPPPQPAVLPPAAAVAPAPPPVAAVAPAPPPVVARAAHHGKRSAHQATHRGKSARSAKGQGSAPSVATAPATVGAAPSASPASPESAAPAPQAAPVEPVIVVPAQVHPGVYPSSPR